MLLNYKFRKINQIGGTGNKIPRIAVKINKPKEGEEPKEEENELKVKLTTDNNELKIQYKLNLETNKHTDYMIEINKLKDLRYSNEITKDFKNLSDIDDIFTLYALKNYFKNKIDEKKRVLENYFNNPDSGNLSSIDSRDWNNTIYWKKKGGVTFYPIVIPDGTNIDDLYKLISGTEKDYEFYTETEKNKRELFDKIIINRDDLQWRKYKMKIENRFKKIKKTTENRDFIELYYLYSTHEKIKKLFDAKYKKNALPNDNLLNPVFEKITTNDQKKLNDEILENWVAKYDKYLEFRDTVDLLNEDYNNFVKILFEVENKYTIDGVENTYNPFIIHFNNVYNSYIKQLKKILIDAIKVDNFNICKSVLEQFLKLESINKELSDNIKKKYKGNFVISKPLIINSEIQDIFKTLIIKPNNDDNDYKQSINLFIKIFTSYNVNVVSFVKNIKEDLNSDVIKTFRKLEEEEEKKEEERQRREEEEKKKEKKRDERTKQLYTTVTEAMRTHHEIDLENCNIYNEEADNLTKLEEDHILYYFTGTLNEDKDLNITSTIHKDQFVNIDLDDNKLSIILKCDKKK